MKKYIYKYKSNLLLSTFFGILEVYFIYLYSLKSAEFVDIIIKNDNPNIGKVCITTIIYIAFSYISFYISELNCQKFANSISFELRHDYFEGLYENKISSFYLSKKENYITDIDQNIDQLRLDYLMNLPNSIKGIGQVLVYLIALYKIHIIILTLTIVFVIFPAMISKIFSKKISNLRILRSNKHSIYLSRLNELLDGFLLIKESNSKKFFIKRFDESNKSLLDARKKLNLSTSILYESMFALNLLSAMLIILFASILVSKGHISLKELIASITLVSISTNAIAEAFRYTSNVFSTKEIKNLVLEKLPKKDFIKKDKLKPKLDLNIKNLDFSYDNNKIFLI
ncbi:ABC transporter ATP-binding protein [Anaerococcus porci]|nr:ABC transporter ATP-binding protein [Anaerococcus porci]